MLTFLSMCLRHSGCFFFILINLTAQTLLQVHASAFLCGHCIFPGLFARSCRWEPGGHTCGHTSEKQPPCLPHNPPGEGHLWFSDSFLAWHRTHTEVAWCCVRKAQGQWRPAALQISSVAHSTVSMCLLIFVFSVVSPQWVNKDDTCSSCLWVSRRNLGTRVLKIVETK